MIHQEINLAIKEDKAESVILGCTMQFGFFEQLQKEFSVPIIDSMLAVLKYVELLVEIRDKMNWYTSKVGGFATPDRAEIKE
jgi:allantoin racemase